MQARRTVRFLLLLSVSVGGLAVLAQACGGGTSSDGGSDGTTEGGAAADDGSAPLGVDATNSSDCPAAAPNNQSTCTESALSCVYGGDVVCDCGQAPGNALVWTCTTCTACPAAQPTGTCQPATAACNALPPCSYGGDVVCVCPNGGGGGGGGGRTWVCGTCPGSQPAMNGTCDTINLSCPYGPTTCTCDQAGGRPTDGGAGAWRCVTPPPACPSTAPMPGQSCVDGTGGNAGCTYPGAVTCRCLAARGDAGAEWSCN